MQYLETSLGAAAEAGAGRQSAIHGQQRQNPARRGAIRRDWRSLGRRKACPMPTRPNTRRSAAASATARSKIIDAVKAKEFRSSLEGQRRRSARRARSAMRITGRRNSGHGDKREGETRGPAPRPWSPCFPVSPSGLLVPVSPCSLSALTQRTTFPVFGTSSPAASRSMSRTCSTFLCVWAVCVTTMRPLYSLIEPGPPTSSHD